MGPWATVITPAANCFLGTSQCLRGRRQHAGPRASGQVGASPGPPERGWPRTRQAAATGAGAGPPEPRFPAKDGYDHGPQAPGLLLPVGTEAEPLPNSGKEASLRGPSQRQPLWSVC